MSGCPRSLQVATFSRGAAARPRSVRLPPQSPSRYIRGERGAALRPGPVAPAVSKSLHSPARRYRSGRVSGCPRSLQVATFAGPDHGTAHRVRLPPQSPSRYIRGGAGCGCAACPVAPAVSKSLHSGGPGPVPLRESGCPRSLQVATFALSDAEVLDNVRLPPQSPSRYIRASVGRADAAGPVAPAVSKSLHSATTATRSASRSGCPRSLQVATFARRSGDPPRAVRLPPQSPSRYILRVRDPQQQGSPVAPAVSKSLHSGGRMRARWVQSGCPRSLQVATFIKGYLSHGVCVRLPPQSPSRYIQWGMRITPLVGPVAPAVSKSLHSLDARTRLFPKSGCPRSLQVATFCPRAWRSSSRVRLPPQSPSRYIQSASTAGAPSSPVAPAVSKSLHSVEGGATGDQTSGCPRSLQVATFGNPGRVLRDVVRLPPQSPSRYIQPLPA